MTHAQSTRVSPLVRLRSLGLLPRRCVAAIADIGLIALATWLPLAVLLLLPDNPDGSMGHLLVAIPLIMALFALSVLLSWWYWVIRPARRRGRTFAMEWLGLRVVGLDGTRATSGQLAVRWVMLLVDGMFAGAVGLIAMLATAGRQRLGDIAAGTIVLPD